MKKTDSIGKVILGTRRKGSHAKRKGPKDKKVKPYIGQGK